MQEAVVGIGDVGERLGSGASAGRRALLTSGRWSYGTYDPVVSYDVHLFRFQNGESTEIDASRLMEMIQPLIAWREEEHDHVRLRATDGGEADLYGVARTPRAVCSRTPRCRARLRTQQRVARAR